MFHPIEYIHFVGIGGSGMSGIAEVLHHAGYCVSGSDMHESGVTAKLRHLGIPVFIGHEADNISKAQVLVVSSAIPKHNPEVLEAHNRRLPVIHRSEMLAELMRLKRGIVVAGTHGKTTTTSIAAFVLHKMDLDPTLVIGGRINSFDSSSKLGKSEFFIAEGDESDGSFLRLTPSIAIITNIDKDHLDHYGHLDNIIKAFESFVEKIPFYGAVCLCIDDPIVQTLIPKIRRKVVTFGLRKDADITVEDVQLEGFQTTFTPVVYGKTCPPVTLKMPGLYNVRNALGAFALGAVLQLDSHKVAHAMSQFDGVLHRFSLVGTDKNTIVIDDYAHNPKKIETVLNGTKESFPHKKIVAIFQPHRYSRMALQIDDFATCFSCADKVIVAPIFSAGEQPVPGLTAEHIAHRIRVGSFHGETSAVLVAADLAQCAAYACQTRLNDQEECLFITLGAGDVKNVGPAILEQLQACPDKR